MTFNPSPGESADSAHSISSGVFDGASVQVKGTIGSSFVTDVIRVERSGVENAIKILTPGASNDPDLVSRFLKNARYNQALNEFSGMPITEVVDSSTRPYLVMQRVAESSLLEVIRHHAPVDAYWLMNLLLPIARSLDTVHQRNVLHANIKPSNLLIILENDEEKFLLVDYIEPSLAAMSATLTGAGVYAAPEFRAGMPVSNRSDIYSLGAIVYEALSGRVPTGAYRSSNGQFHVWRTGMNVPYLTNENPEIPRAVSDYVMNAISPQAISRQATASAFIEDTLRALEQPRSRVKVADPVKEHTPVPMLLISAGVFLAIMLLFGAYALVRSVFSNHTPKTVTSTTHATTSTVPPGNDLTEDEILLIRHIPTINQECRTNRATGADRKWVIATAIVDCTSSGTTSLSYGLFENIEEMNDTYIDHATALKNAVENNGGKVIEIKAGAHPCESSANESGEWGIPTGMRGKFICVSDPSPRILWTESTTHIIGDASLSSGSIGDLISWWETESGPK